MRDIAQEALDIIAQGGLKEPAAPAMPQPMTDDDALAAQMSLYQEQTPQAGSGQAAMTEMMKAYSEHRLDDSGMSLIQERASKLPFGSDFVNEILNTPIIDPLEAEQSAIKNKFAERLKGKNANGNSVSDILNKVDQMDASKKGMQSQVRPSSQRASNDAFALPSDIAGAPQQKPAELLSEGLETRQPATRGGVDIATLNYLVESEVNKRLANLQGAHNTEQGENTLKGIILKDQGTFWLVDNNDNIYECTMTFKGKKKKKK